MIMFSCPRSH